MKFDIEKLFHSFIKTNRLDIQLSYAMPPGYEDAFGTFDILKKTLFLNKALLGCRLEFEILFYFYHELRHAMQYICSSEFSKPIQNSIHYIVLYNGQCFKIVDGVWKSCQLVGEEEYFTLVYKSLPYELDANLYARDTVKNLLHESESEIESLCSLWLPQKNISEEELASIFRQIDRLL